MKGSSIQTTLKIGNFPTFLVTVVNKDPLTTVSLQPIIEETPFGRLLDEQGTVYGSALRSDKDQPDAMVGLKFALAEALAKVLSGEIQNG